MTHQTAISRALVGTLMLLLFGCTTPGPPDTAIPTAIPSNTPLPPATSTPTLPPPPTDTPEPTSTATPDLTATAEAQAASTQAALIGEIDAELREIGYSVDQGDLAWRSRGATELRITSFNSHNWEIINRGTDYSDFVLRSEVTWESTSGLAVCGFWLRAQGDDEDAEHYKFLTIRLSGMPSWDVEYWKHNRWQSTISPGGKILNTPHIDQEQGSTNTFLMAAEGNELAVYANGHRLGIVTINSLRSGQIGFYIWQESGDTTCTFDNAWLWDLTET